MCRRGDDGKCEVCGKDMAALELETEGLVELTPEDLRVAAGGYASSGGSYRPSYRSGGNCGCTGGCTHHCGSQYNEYEYRSY